MPDATVHPVPQERADGAHIDAERYRAMYAKSLEDSDTFWSEQARHFVDWFRPWDEVQSWDLHTGAATWFAGARLNVAWNCLDRHLEDHANRPAIVWEGDDPTESRTLTYRELHEQVCRFATALKGLGVKKGDRVCIYLPMIPETAVAMLACARLGAVHVVVFGGFSPGALRSRIDDCGCSIVVTADQGLRGGRKMPLKANADRACEGAAGVRRMIVVRRCGEAIEWNNGRDLWYHELLQSASSGCAAVELDAEHPLFILHTSGTTGRPKGVVHSSGGYLLHVAMTHRHVLDYRDGEVFWCTADIGWVAGHSYLVYGPLANGATTLMFEGLPNHPSPSRFREIIDKHRVNILYSAPTMIRALMAHGDSPLAQSEGRSLRVLGSVGEPLDPKAWEWYSRVIGGGRCPVIDTWWQTEAGGIMLAPLPGATPLKPGSVGWPYFGVAPALIDDEGNVLEGAASGNLVLSRSWPGQTRSLYGDPEGLRITCLDAFPGYWFTGDGACRDEDGHYWITGRVEDALDVGGRRIGTATIEEALMRHESVAEAAIVTGPGGGSGGGADGGSDDGADGGPHGYPGVHAYVTLMHDLTPDAALEEAILVRAREKIGASALPGTVRWAPRLPKTRSGKIMRRILRKIASGDVDELGDTSTLADPGVVDGLVGNRRGA